MTPSPDAAHSPAPLPLVALVSAFFLASTFALALLGRRSDPALRGAARWLLDHAWQLGAALYVLLAVLPLLAVTVLSVTPGGRGHTELFAAYAVSVLTLCALPLVARLPRR